MNDVLAEGKILVEGEADDRRRDVEKLSNPLEQGSSSAEPSSAMCRAKPETVIVIEPKESEAASRGNGNRKPESSTSETSGASGEGRDGNSVEAQRRFCIIDGCNGESLSGENLESEVVCRICQSSSDRLSETSDLTQLGCSCKGELGIAHLHCAKAWFKRKGNRQCEICGETAKNVTTGIAETGFRIEYWNEMRLVSAYSLEREDSCSWRRSLANFLVAFLVIAFVLLWVFRIEIL